MAIYEATRIHYNETNVYHDYYEESGVLLDFPVMTRDGRIVSSLELSETLNNIPVVKVDSVFINPDLLVEAQQWLKQNRMEILARKAGEKS